jgi:hypothetical protein
MTGGKGAWRWSPAARAVVLTALSMALALGVGFVVFKSSRNAESDTLGGVEPMTDEQATNQVLDSTRDIVDAANLRDVSASVVFLSCTSSHDPPYQAAVHLNFGLPLTNSVKRISEVAAAMRAHGWQQAPAMAEHFGMKLTRGAVTSTFHENPDDRRFATMRIYGECRNTSDHRNDNPAFTDITDRLR